MSNIILLVTIIFLWSTNFCDAAIIYLKNGAKVEGEIISEESYRVKIKVGGIPYTYQRGEIDHIETNQGATPAAKLSTVPSRDAGQIPAAKRELILRYLDANGTRDSMSRNFKQIAAGLSNEEAATFLKAYSVDEIIERMVPIYDKYYREEELKAMINFYKSPAGLKVLEATPLIMKETSDIAAAYFREKGPRK
jgi:hypothetical protein